MLGIMELLSVAIDIGISSTCCFDHQRRTGVTTSF